MIHNHCEGKIALQTPQMGNRQIGKQLMLFRISFSIWILSSISVSSLNKEDGVRNAGKAL
jgi:hypothetical protein